MYVLRNVLSCTLVSGGRGPPPPALSEPYVTVSRRTALTARGWGEARWCQVHAESETAPATRSSAYPPPSTNSHSQSEPPPAYVGGNPTADSLPLSLHRLSPVSGGAGGSGFEYLIGPRRCTSLAARSSCWSATLKRSASNSSSYAIGIGRYFSLTAVDTFPVRPREECPRSDDIGVLAMTSTSWP